MTIADLESRGNCLFGLFGRAGDGKLGKGIKSRVFTFARPVRAGG